MVKAKLFVTYDEMVCTMMERKKENGTNPWIQKRGDWEKKKKEKSKKNLRCWITGDQSVTDTYIYDLRPTSIVRGSTSGYCII